MDWDDDLGTQVFGHAEQVNRGHLVLNTDWVVPVVVDGNVDIEVPAVFGKVV